jgi:hypothetical protein
MNNPGIQPDANRPSKEVTIELDSEPLTLPKADLTPNEILSEAGLDPATHYLVLVHGRQQDSFQGKGDELIHVHNKETFISLSTGPTTTS